MAAYTRPRQEERVRRYCEQQGIEVFLPSLKSWHRWSDRRRLINSPLFPSYVFLHLDSEHRNRAMRAPGFLWFVRGRNGPVAVAPEELQNLRCLLTSGLEFDPLPGVELGREVEIIDGPMRGVRGHLMRKGHSALVLTVSAIQGAVRVSVPDTRWLRPLTASRFAGLQRLGAGVEARS